MERRYDGLNQCIICEDGIPVKEHYVLELTSIVDGHEERRVLELDRTQYEEIKTIIITKEKI
jgi:hypothetical protein